MSRCRVFVTVRQRSGDSDDVISFDTSGAVRSGRNGFSVSYRDERVGDRGLVSIFRSDDGVSIRRAGRYPLEMDLVSGQSTDLDYRTDYGAVRLCARCGSIRSELGEDGGVLDFSYRLSQGDEIINVIDYSVRFCYV